MKRSNSEKRSKRPSQIKMFGYTILYAIGLVGNKMSKDVKFLIGGIALAGFMTVCIGISTTASSKPKIISTMDNVVSNKRDAVQMTVNHDGILGMEFEHADAADFNSDTINVQNAADTFADYKSTAELSNGRKGIIATPEPVVEEVVEPEPEPVYEGEIVIADENTDTSGLEYLGRFTITHYCCENYPHICNDGDATQTASGEPPVPYHTCAVDTSRIPMLSTIVINGNEYRCNDTGGAIRGNRIDLCVDTHDNAMALGKYDADVYIKR